LRKNLELNNTKPCLGGSVLFVAAPSRQVDRIPQVQVWVDAGLERETDPLHAGGESDPRYLNEGYVEVSLWRKNGSFDSS
jgi:hypothetical protein